jgi:hypothetical protein
MSRKSGNRFSDKDMCKSKNLERIPTDAIGMRSRGIQPNTSCSTPSRTTTVLSTVMVVRITGMSKWPAV